MHRRTFLCSSAALAACGQKLVPLECGEVLLGTFVGTRPFDDEIARTRPVGTVYGEGLDARQIIDLASLTEDALVTPAEAFYLRTAAPIDLGDPAQWSIDIDGLVEAPVQITIDELLASVVPIGVLHFECSGNGDSASFGLMSAGDFAGVPLSDVLARAAAQPSAVAVRITGRDTHPPSDASDAGASWVFRFEEVVDAWLVTHQDGAPLLVDHGAPVRLIVPGWYGCTNIKWVERITFVSADEPATSQMMEFANRTHQDGVPALARDYVPAAAQCSAVAVRVEEWEVDGHRVFRVFGVTWGGQTRPDALHLWMDDDDLGPVTLCDPGDVATWAWWHAELPHRATGSVTLRLTAVGVPALRLDNRHYARVVDLT